MVTAPLSVLLPASVEAVMIAFLVGATSSKVNFWTSCGLPSSKTWKSDGFRPLTG